MPYGDHPAPTRGQYGSPNFCLEDDELQTDWGYCRHVRWNSCPVDSEWRGSLRNCRGITTHVVAWCRMRSDDKVRRTLVL